MSYTHIICFDESIPYSLLPNFSSIFFLTFYSQRHVFPHRQTPSLLVLPDVTWVWIHLLEYGLSISVHVPKGTQLSLATGVISGEWILGHGSSGMSSFLTHTGILSAFFLNRSYNPSCSEFTCARALSSLANMAFLQM